MPPINGVAATVGAVAVSVAVAAAIAIYESPELQRMASDLRRRIAIALHAFGDSISPQERENLFNRPEDAEGFLLSRGLNLPDVDADPESLRRQREELMFWNAVRESQMEKEREDAKWDSYSEKQRPRSSTRGSSFDDFLKQDENEKGAFVYQSGHELQNSEGVIRRRGGDGLRGLNHSIYTNPFADEHGIDEDIAFENSLMDPEKDEIVSDIYSATDLGDNEPSRFAALSAQQTAPSPKIPTIVEVNEPVPQPSQAQTEFVSEPPEGEAYEDEASHGAYSSIQAWAEGASDNANFYSPLPQTPASVSEAEVISAGDLTPTDSASLVGSGEDIADEAVSTKSYDVMSEVDGIMTPTWTEVGSVVSEMEPNAAHA
ncbi:hypothetical protein F5Y18DRAFT_434149 [Xylariaceae sp. FL1019]|nr:hypothetical protein F5Y18DRAFT_434149 [Xylariaceae sp. FL1019]